MGKSNRNPPSNLIYAYELSTDLRRDKYGYEKLAGSTPQTYTIAAGLSALPTAAAGQTDYMRTPGGNLIEFYQTTAQALQPIAHATKGLVLDGDQVADESAEYIIGGNSTTNPFAQVVGTDLDFFLRVRLEITDASGSDQLLVGWRKVQTNLVPTSFLNGGAPGYTDFAAIGFAGTKADPNNVAVATASASSTTTSTQVSFTWADTKIHDLEVRVVGGRAIYFINGARCGNLISKDAVGGSITAQQTVSAPAYTFTAGLTVVPFVFVRQDTDLCDAVYLAEYEVGHLTQRGLDPNNE